MRQPLTLLAWMSLLWIPGPASAVEPPKGNGFLDGLAVADPRLRPSAVVQPVGEAGAAAAPGVVDGWTAFQQAEGGDWAGYIDRRNGLLEIAEGAGIPWIPGPGNQLTRQDVASHLTGAEVDLKALESIARAFLPRVAPLLGVDPKELVLNRGRSGRFGDQVWFVDFDLKRGGRIVEGARVVFRVSHGNLVQLGAENLPSPGQSAPERESVRREEALAILAAHLRGFSAADTFLDGGSLHLLPVAVDDARFTDGFEPGHGRGLALVWQLVFRRQRETGTWRARVDAVSGELLELVDTNRYARAHGGVYPVAGVFANEIVLPMPFADLSSGGSTDSAGSYAYPGSPVSSTLSGPYVDVYDDCGPIGLTSTGSGRLAFGTSGGTNCATPGKGGAGNTHASRMQFYHVNRIKEVGRGWLPGNAWLGSPLAANVNIWQTCNAYWDGSINFFLSGGGCGNTGEIAAISLHEYGHGLDDFDGIPSSDHGTGEAYADLTAALMLRDSCIGPGFYLGGNCSGFGDACTACSGVRDIDWAKHASNTPHTVASFTEQRCWNEPSYAGPCGAQGHCESQVITEAVWDLAARDLPDAGSNAAWAITERLWYLSRPTATSAFTCNTATSPWTSNGCDTGSLWRTLRAVDDDDGNLANGTPHSCQIYAALNRHGIACPSDPGANVCFSACTPPAAPSLSATAGQEQVQLAWSGGAGQVYDVYESETGCSSGWRRVANDLSSTSLLDTVVFPGQSHSYQVIAHPAGQESCSSAPSACQSAVPAGPACAPPAVPTGVTALATGIDRIQVSWNAAAGASDYQVWRATSAAGPFQHVATVTAPATQWTDKGLASQTTYFYVVRSAFDDCVSADSAMASATTLSCQTTTLYANDFETGSGLSDWTLGFNSGLGWRGIQSCSAHSGNRIFRFGGPGCNDPYEGYQYGSVQVRGATGIEVPEAASSTRLAFWHRWDFELYYDQAWLTVSIDGSADFFVPASAFLATGYNQTYYFSGEQSTFVRSEVDLEKVCDLFYTGESQGCAGRTLRIAFWAYTYSGASRKGWFLDDVTVTSCVLHGCTGAPQIGTASSPADNQIQVAWSNGSPASSTFNVYRALGTCAQPGPFEKVAGGIAGFAHLDAPVSGGVTWAYRVAGLDASGACESDLSGCVEATAGGPCTLGPVFAGLASATNAADATCGVDLDWPAAVSRCGNSLTYEVHRSTTPNFTPSPSTLIASGLTGTSWLDQAGVGDRTAYHYIVRAVDAGNGRTEENAVERSAETTGPILPWSLSETFEAAGGFDNPGWEHHALSGPNDWKWSTLWDRSPIHSWFSPSHAGSSERELVSPPFRATENTTLSFWHTYELDGCYDGGTLEISADDGLEWTVLPDDAFTSGGFDGTVFSGSNPLYGLRVWCGGTAGALSQVEADLSAWAGEDVRLRWHAGDDSYIRYLGWFVDDVTIAGAEQALACQPLPPAPPAPLDFYTLLPCRLVDTRGPGGPAGGPALPPFAQRAFTAAGACGIPATAKALVLNVTVVQPAGGGYLTLFPTGEAAPLASTINFAAGQVRSNIAVVPLGAGTGAFGAKNGSAGTLHVVVDVTGYFE